LYSPNIATGNFSSVSFRSDNDVPNQVEFASIRCIFSDKAAATLASQLAFTTRKAGAVTEQARISDTGNFLVGTTAGPGGGDMALVMAQGTALSSMASNTGAVQVKDVAGTAEVFAVDEGATATQLSSHNFELFDPDPAEPFPASFYAESPVTGHRVAIDTMRLARLVEGLTGETLVHYAAMPVEDLADWHADQRRNAEQAMVERERYEARVAQQASREADHADAVTAWEALPSVEDTRRADWEALPEDENGDRYRLAEAMDDSGKKVRVRVKVPEPPARVLRREDVAMVGEDGRTVRVPHVRERPPVPEPLGEAPPALPIVKEPPDYLKDRMIALGRWDQRAHDELVAEVEEWKATRT
jgi:hypothetical protein